MKAEAERRLAEWRETGSGLVASSLIDGVAFYSTGLGDAHSHDAQLMFIPCSYDKHTFDNLFRIDTQRYFADPDALAPQRESILIIANPVLQHSEGEIVLESADPKVPPAIHFNYYADPHDLKVMVAVAASCDRCRR